MKLTTLIVSLSLIGTAYGALPKLSWERDTSSGIDRYSIENRNGQWSVEKTSNYFDQAVDLRLGKFHGESNPGWQKIEQEIQDIITTLKTAEKNLTAIGQSFNALNRPTSPHSPYFQVGEWRVYPGSALYPRLEVLMARVQKLSLKLDEGVALDAARKNYIFYADGKEASREGFNARFFCESSRFPTRCLARQWGALYLE